MKEERGFTLIELVVVVSIVMLLLAWGVPSYSTWKMKHDIETQMAQLYSDLQYTRMYAYGNKVVTGVYWGTGTSFTSYQIKYDASSPLNNSIDDTADVQIGATVRPKYAITSSASQNSVSFDGRGFLNLPSADNANPVTFSVSSTFGAGINCVSVSSTRVILGVMNAGSCAPK
jgi:prepilin-type N-terminal cleavage/methylation domain-containing protein